MIEGAEKYLRKRAQLGANPIVAPPCSHVDQAVVVPIYAEEATIDAFLASIAGNDPRELASTLVVCVVNNPAAEYTPAYALEENLRVLDGLRSRAGHLPFVFGWIDASSAGSELSGRGGVGAARKLGMDWALECLEHSTSARRPWIASCDADAPVAPEYLRAVRAWADGPAPWAAVTHFEHVLPEDTAHRDAIVAYELFMRYHVLGLDYARSPFAYPAMGSITLCTGQAYVATAGMNRREAGEDFYFLQELAKTGPVDLLPDAVVFPSPRTSSRVPFGTGLRVQYLLDSGGGMVAYHPEIYRVIRQWIESADALFVGNGADPMGLAAQIDCCLAEFLANQRFNEQWKTIARQAPSPAHRARQFHRWFDGFRTLKLIHHLRDAEWPNLPVVDALAMLCDWKDPALPAIGPPANRDPLELLRQMRLHARVARTLGLAR
jgi:glycosyltransferase involved in cell wall biosynthesis